VPLRLALPLSARQAVEQALDLSGGNGERDGGGDDDEGALDDEAPEQRDGDEAGKGDEDVYGLPSANGAFSRCAQAW
jgi:hypothetical protein